MQPSLLQSSRMLFLSLLAICISSALARAQIITVVAKLMEADRAQIDYSRSSDLDNENIFIFQSDTAIIGIEGSDGRIVAVWNVRKPISEAREHFFSPSFLPHGLKKLDRYLVNDRLQFTQLYSKDFESGLPESLRKYEYNSTLSSADDSLAFCLIGHSKSDEGPHSLAWYNTRTHSKGLWTLPAFDRFLFHAPTSMIVSDHTLYFAYQAMGPWVPYEIAAWDIKADSLLSKSSIGNNVASVSILGKDKFGHLLVSGESNDSLFLKIYDAHLMNIRSVNLTNALSQLDFMKSNEILPGELLPSQFVGYFDKHDGLYFMTVTKRGLYVLKCNYALMDE